jgi:transposase
MLKSMPGSIRDIKSLHAFMNEFPLKECILVLDRGFQSAITENDLVSLGASFIQPLRRNSKLIDYSLEPQALFAFRDRDIKYVSKELLIGEKKARLFLYEDVLLRGEEHSNLVKLKLVHG